VRAFASLAGRQRLATDSQSNTRNAVYLLMPVMHYDWPLEATSCASIIVVTTS
jgi:hypothetical protein